MDDIDASVRAEKTVYVIVSARDDVVAVFTSESDARLCADRFYNPMIHTVSIDPAIPKEWESGLFPWVVLMDREGRVFRTRLEKLVSRGPTHLDFPVGSSVHRTRQLRSCPTPDEYLAVGCYARDENHAIEIATEKHAQIIRDDQWVPVCED